VSVAVRLADSSGKDRGGRWMTFTGAFVRRETKILRGEKVRREMHSVKRGTAKI
jgi:hypothetical protein